MFLIVDLLENILFSVYNVLPATVTALVKLMVWLERQKSVPWWQKHSWNPSPDEVEEKPGGRWRELLWSERSWWGRSGEARHPRRSVPRGSVLKGRERPQQGGASRRAALRLRGGRPPVILGDHCLNSRSSEKPLARGIPEASGKTPTFLKDYSSAENEPIIRTNRNVGEQENST